MSTRAARYSGSLPAVGSTAAKNHPPKQEQTPAADSLHESVEQPNSHPRSIPTMKNDYGRHTSSHEVSPSYLRRASSKFMVKPSTQTVARRWLMPPPPSATLDLPPTDLAPNEEKALAHLTRLWESAKSNFKPPLSVKEQIEFSDRARVRYLRARDLDSKKALSMMLKTVILRRQLGQLKASDLAPLNKQGSIYRRGFDKFHRPIIYLR